MNSRSVKSSLRIVSYVFIRRDLYTQTRSHKVIRRVVHWTSTLCGTHIVCSAKISLPGKCLKFRCLNGFMDNQFHGLPSCQNSAGYTPFLSRTRVRHRTDRQTDRQTDDGRQCIMSSLHKEI